MEKPDKSNIDINILPPHSATQFHINFSNPKLDAKGEEWKKKLSMQVNSLVTDLSAGKLVILIDHAGVEGFLSVIDCIASYECTIELLLTNPQTGGILDSMTLYGRCDKHEFTLDYHANVATQAKHLFIFSVK